MSRGKGAVTRSPTTHVSSTSTAPDPLHALLEAWERRAQDLGPYSPPAATALRACARELEEALRSRDGAVLTLAQASAESGYSVDHLGRLLREGSIPNAGRRGAPRLQFGSVPRRSKSIAGPIAKGYHAETDARTLLGRQGEC